MLRNKRQHQIAKDALNMLRESSKQFRLNDDSGHAAMCELHAERLSSLLFLSPPDPTSMSGLEIIEDIQNTIHKECGNIDDAEAYVENCLLTNDCGLGMGKYYGKTSRQMQYFCQRALLSL